MQAEDRVIHFSAELIHKPVKPQKDRLQKLYYDLSQTRTASYDSTDFSNLGQAKFYSRRGKTQSIALFLPDRAVLIEEWADIPLSGFLDRVQEVGTRLLAAREQPKFVAHTATVRSTFALTHHKDARVFLMETMCGQGGRISPYLQRPMAVAGLKFVMPETPDHPGMYNVQIESFRQSQQQNEIFAEVKGVFGSKPTGPDEMDVVMQHVRDVRSFVSDHVHPYLDQFDQPAPDPS